MSTIISVTASVTFEYDTADPESPVKTIEDARADVESMLSSGDIAINEFGFTVTVEPDIEPHDNVLDTTGQA